MACSCSSTSFTSFAGASPSTCASSSSSSSSSAPTSLSFSHHQHQLPGSKQALLRLDCEKNAKQRLRFAVAAKQGQGQYDKAKKTTQRGGGPSAGVAVKEDKASWKGGNTGGKNPKSYNKNPNPKSSENSNPRFYSGGRSGSRLLSKEDEDDDEDEEDDDDNGDDSRRNPRYKNLSNSSRDSRSYNTSTSSRGFGSVRVVSDDSDEEEDDEDGSRRNSRSYKNNNTSSRNSRSNNTTSSSVKGGSRLSALSDEEEDDEEEDEDDFDEEEGGFVSGEDDYAELPITPIPPAGFVLAEDGSVSIMAPPHKRVTTLVDLETKLPLDCLIRRVFSSSDGRQCFLLCPLDTPVQILRIDDGDVLKEISDEELEDVFPTASYELAKRRLHLIQSGYCLTLRGGFCFSEEDVIDLDTVYGESGEGDRSFNEGVEVASFLWNDSEYLIFTPFDPLMFVSYKDNKTGELLIADNDLLEDEAVLDAIDEEKEFQAHMEEDNLIVDEDDEEE